MTETLRAFAAAFVAPALTLLGAPVTWLEVVAFALSLAMVVANARVNPVGWPLAIAASALYGGLFAHSGLYGEASLQLVFIAFSLWGWRQWLAGRTADGAPLAVRRLDARGRAGALVATLALWPAIALALRRFTDSTVPWLDALPTAGSLVGQWLLARKWIDNWDAWIAVNAISVVLFASKQLWLTVALYALFFVMSFWGRRAWHRLAAGGA